MKEFEVIERMATVKELSELRMLVGWEILNEEDLRLGLDNSLYGVCAVIAGNIVGTARIMYRKLKDLPIFIKHL